jgi:hypothetical protein
VSSSLVLERKPSTGFADSPQDVMLDYGTLLQLYANTPGLVADRLKNVLETVAAACRREGVRGIVFAYDEAQNLADSPAQREFPLSLLLDVFQSIQKRDIPFMLVLTGLPTLSWECHAGPARCHHAQARHRLLRPPLGACYRAPARAALVDRQP